MVTTERRQSLKDDLVRAAERLMAEKGLEGVRARDLAEVCGCAIGSIYNAFPDLDALILEVNARTLAAFEAHVADRRATDPDRDAVTALTGLAVAYLDFAAAEPLRWRSLFQHRLPEGKTVPDWYRQAQAHLFAQVEGPLGRLRPGLAAEERALIARTLFSAVHGMVSLGLDEKLAPVPLPVLRAQIVTVISATARGLREAEEGER